MLAIRSMTGFVSEQFNLPEGHLSVYVKSVNSRVLDLQVILSTDILPLEPAIQKIVKALVHRGKVDVQMEFVSSKQDVFHIDPKQLEALTKNLNILQNAIPQGKIDLMSVLKYPGLLKADEHSLNPELEKVILEKVEQSMIKFERSRVDEGEHLKHVFIEKLDQIDLIMGCLKNYLSQIFKYERERIQTKLENLQVTFANTERLEQEVAMLAQKSDFAEEYDRIKGHTAALRAILKNPQEVNGKRMDFLCQELLRESNTMCVKTSHKESTKLALELKLLSEQLREQAQNIE